MPQGLKPLDFTGLIGTAEAVPFYKAFSIEFFRSLQSSSDFFGFTAWLEPRPFKTMIFQHPLERVRADERVMVSHPFRNCAERMGHPKWCFHLNWKMR